MKAFKGEKRNLYQENKDLKKKIEAITISSQRRVLKLEKEINKLQFKLYKLEMELSNKNKVNSNKNGKELSDALLSAIEKSRRK